MFSGIVERICPVVGIHRNQSAAAGSAGTQAVRLDVELGDLLNGLPLGASVACNGVCLTLAERRGHVAAFDVVPETWRNSNLARLRPGDSINVERSLKVGDRIDGHFVQGHVDGLGQLDRIDRQEGEYRLWISADETLMPFIVQKGSVALDGVSLTIAGVEGSRFAVALIPTTLEATALRMRKPGDYINIETDILARIVVSRLQGLATTDNAAASTLTWQKLAESGFIP